MGLTFTKLFSWILPNKEFRIVMVGLDGVGKTTILYNLKLGKIVTTIPTVGFNVETVEYKNINFVVWDVGAYETRRWEQIHGLWKHYFQNTQGLIYVVDSNDKDRVVEAKDELYRILNQDVMRDVAVLVFANKQDRPNAMNTAEVTDNLDLHSVRQRHWHIQGTCATSGEGLYEGLDWLSNIIANKKAIFEGPVMIDGFILVYMDARMPRFWKHYSQNTQGLIYVVDSNDRDRVVEARDDLHKMLNQDELRDVVLLVFANKQDLPNAMSAAEITDKLHLHSVRQHWYIQSTSAISGEGLYEGLDWLSNNIANKASEGNI